MASYKDHCADCLNELGNEFCAVNLWLDEMYEKMPGNFMHRAYHHHKEGVEEAGKKWGDEAAKAAEIHIRRDFPGLDWIPSKKDWEDEEKMLKNSDFYIEMFGKK